MADEYKTRHTFDLPFADFDYETALPKYELHGSRRSPRELTVVGTHQNIDQFAADFSLGGHA